MKRFAGQRTKRRVAVGVLAAMLLAACSAGSEEAVVSVTTTVPPPSTSTSDAPAPDNTGLDTSALDTSTGPTTSQSASSSATSSPAESSQSSVPGPVAPGAAGLPQYPVPAGEPVKVEPDGFTITKLAPGDKAPQFVVVSFDGVGWHEKWQYWKDIQTKVPFHFTGFLSGTYMLSSATKEKYQGPGHAAGKASITWNEPADLPVEIGDLNDALDKGDEIGTHFNGHFCSDNQPGANDWTTADWNNELDQFFGLVRDVDVNNGISEKLNLDPAEVIGERTPCLEGDPEQLFPALKSHNMKYDSSVTRHGISWPTLSPENQIWQLGMAEFPIHGTDHFQITMDYNFYFTQQQANSAGVTPAQSAADSQQVLDTYTDMYNATFNGNRAPLILGNHFNEWNNNAYSDAIGNFVQQTCGKADTYCVPFRDVVDWMEAQDPAVLAALQAQPSEVAAG